MKESIKDIKEQVLINKLVEGNYCVIVYELKMTHFTMIKTIKFIYKNVKEFEERIVNDVKDFDGNNGLSFEWREYD